MKEASITKESKWILCFLLLQFIFTSQGFMILELCNNTPTTTQII